MGKNGDPKINATMLDSNDTPDLRKPSANEFRPRAVGGWGEADRPPPAKRQRSASRSSREPYAGNRANRDDNKRGRDTYPKREDGYDGRRRGDSHPKREDDYSGQRGGNSYGQKDYDSRRGGDYKKEDYQDGGRGGDPYAKKEDYYGKKYRDDRYDSGSYAEKDYAKRGRDNYASKEDGYGGRRGGDQYGDRDYGKRDAESRRGRDSKAADYWERRR